MLDQLAGEEPGFISMVESLLDSSRQIDDRQLQHALDNHKAAKKAGKESQMEKYYRLAQSTGDAELKLYYENRMMMSPLMAENITSEFFQKAVRSGTYSLDEFEDNAEKSGKEMINFSKVDGAGLGIFSSLSSESQRSPERALEVDDFLEKLLNHKDMSRASKILLIARLLTGASTGKSRAKQGGANFGIDLNAYVNKLPKEYDEVFQQIIALRKLGVKDENITVTLILDGTKVFEEDKTVKGSVPNLIGKREKGPASKTLEDAIFKLTGTTRKDAAKANDKTRRGGQLELSDLIRHMTVNESIRLANQAYEELEESRISDTNRIPAKVLKNVMKSLFVGGKVKSSNLIKAIVLAVHLNTSKKTFMVKTKEFKGSTLVVAKRFLKLAKSKSLDDRIMIQDLFLAPVMKSKKNKLK